MKVLIAGVFAVLAAVPLAVLADPPEGKGYHKHHDEGDDDGDRREHGDERDRGEYRGHHKHEDKERREFNDDERTALRGYYEEHPREVERLPPGLAKKRARGKALPPGWERKLQRGERIPDDVWEHRMPVPHEVLIKLPPPPAGVAIVRIHDHVVRVIEKTHEVLDELGLPHPPTPP